MRVLSLIQQLCAQAFGEATTGSFSISCLAESAMVILRMIDMRKMDDDDSDQDGVAVAAAVVEVVVVVVAAAASAAAAAVVVILTLGGVGVF